MNFHLPSFLFGCVVGGTAVALAPRLRPLALELATAFFRLGDGIGVRMARGREGIQDLLAEARARARDHGRAPQQPAQAAAPASN